MRGFFDRAFAFEAKDAQILSSLPDFLTWGPVKSGQTVNYTTALQASAVLACVQVNANGIAQIPWRVMQQLPNGGSRIAREHPLYRLLNRRPNDYMTSFDFRQTLMLHLMLAKNAFVFISRGAAGRILELIPVEPGRVMVTRHSDLSLTYTVTAEQGGETRTLTQENVWHLKGLSWNGWMGLDGVKLAREAIGLSLALEEAHARLHANGAQPSGTYAVEGKLTEEQHAKLTAWIKKHAAAENRGNPLVLDNAAKWLATQMTGVDAQHLQTRQFQVLEVCRFANTQPMMVFAADKPTYTTAEQMFTAHAVHGLAPHCENIEQSADVYLLGVEDDAGYYTHLDLKGLMRGSMKDQAEYYSKALGAGGSPAWMTQDEVRDESDLTPMGGDAAKLREPTNVAAKVPATGDPADPAGDTPDPADNQED